MDIIYKIVWAESKDFSNPLPFCDYCGKWIEDYPCPVLFGPGGSNPHALCDACRIKSAISKGDTEYFETLAYQSETEPPRPKVNFGGRRKDI